MESIDLELFQQQMSMLMGETSLIQKLISSQAFSMVLDYMAAPDLLRIQLLNKEMYETLVPQYFMTTNERKNILSKMLIGSKVCR